MPLKLLSYLNSLSSLRLLSSLAQLWCTMPMRYSALSWYLKQMLIWVSLLSLYSEQLWFVMMEAVGLCDKDLKKLHK